MKKKLAMIIFVLTICPVILCGCWNYVEIDNLAIVAGIAIDKDKITNKFIVTTEIITTQGVTANISSEIYSSQGDSIFSAVRNTIETTGLKLFWSDAKVVIISKAIAQEGLSSVIDWTNREPTIRPTIWMIISKGETASEILKSKIKLNEVVSFHLNETMKSGDIISKFPKSLAWSFVDSLSSKVKSEAVATVKNQLNNGIFSPHLEGSAIFKSDKLAGYLDGNETLYMLMVQNKIKDGLINLKNVLGPDKNVTLEIYGNKTNLTPVYDNGKASIIIDIYPVVVIGEVGGTNYLINEENLKTLQSEAEKKIQVQIQFLIDKLQRVYHSDVLGFVKVFENERPKGNKNFNKNGENIFEIIKADVNVHLEIKGSGRTNNAIPQEKE